MKTTLRITLSSLLLLLSFADVSATSAKLPIGVTLYIDQTLGNDAHSGTSEAEAWQSFKQINEAVLSPGTQVLLKRGETWNERLVIRGRGTREQWITIGAYGDNSAQPRISLTNHEDDIAILITDLFVGDGRQQRIPMDFIRIEDIEVANTRMGIYYRTIMGTQSTGFTVQNCTFTNIHCDNILEFINTVTGDKPSNLGKVLNASKGGLSPTLAYRKGGQSEYVFPAAIFIGGQVGLQLVDGPHQTVLTELTVHNCKFNDVFSGIMSWFYFPFLSASSDILWRRIVHKVRITNCSGHGFMNGMIAFDGVDGGAEIVPDSDYMMTSSEQGWGVIQNNTISEGATLPYRFLLNGTTGVILNNSQNFLVEHCEFSRMNNFGHPDGCGFDFESHNTQVTMRNCKFISNCGESLLLMNGGNFGGNSRIRICDNLFVDNVKATKKYDFDLMFSLEHDGHRDVKVFNNVIIMNKKNELGQDIKPYEKRDYITFENNLLYYLDKKGKNITGTFWGEPYTYKGIAIDY